MRSVLIVDDDDAIRHALTEFLVEEGYEVRGAPQGAAALAALEYDAPSAILLDLMMPVMGGSSFRRRQLAGANLSEIPLLVMSTADTCAVVTAETKVWAHLPKATHLAFVLDILWVICREDAKPRLPAFPQGSRRLDRPREARTARSR